MQAWRRLACVEEVPEDPEHLGGICDDGDDLHGAVARAREAIGGRA
jgi:hypothetical protein